jgi:GntR family transcriptional regulator / MocR family aminotransferase
MPNISSAITPVISINRALRTPFHRQIYDGYQTTIVSGRLRPGQPVPSTRALAMELGVSRIPVLTAYAQLLAEGYFQSRVGIGTAVSLSLPGQVLQPKAGTVPVTAVSRPRIGKHSVLADSIDNPPWQRGWGAFAVGQIALDEFPFRVWKKLFARHSNIVSPGYADYCNPMGLRQLRQAIAVYLGTARGVQCDAEQIMIVNGSQQALDIAVRALLCAGTDVWMEEPGYRFARSVLALNDCRVIPVPVDNDGLDVAAGIKRSPKARAALVTPSHQYPLGCTMSASRRLELLDWAERARSWILEDDYDSEFRYECMPISSLQGLDRNARVIYIGTLSKVLFPSLRLGYMVVPTDLIEPFRSTRFAMDIGPAIFHQAVLADFICQGHFSRHIRRMRSLYNERRKALVEAITSELGDGFEITGAQAGMHLCVVRNGICDREIVVRAAQAKVWVVPLSSFYAAKNPRQGLVLGFGSTPAEKMRNAVSKLRSAF